MAHKAAVENNMPLSYSMVESAVLKSSTDLEQVHYFDFGNV